jgi:hypothetical protein
VSEAAEEPVEVVAQDVHRLDRCPTGTLVLNPWERGSTRAASTAASRVGESAPSLCPRLRRSATGVRLEDGTRTLRIEGLDTSDGPSAGLVER